MVYFKRGTTCQEGLMEKTSSRRRGTSLLQRNEEHNKSRRKNREAGRASRPRAHLRCVTGPSGGARRILILTADAGSGHRSAAHALELAFRELYGAACEVSVVNPMHLPGAPAILRSAERSYVPQITNVPEWYQFQYEATDSKLLARLLKLSAGALLLRPMRRLLEARPVDAIVSVYPLYPRAVIDAGRELGHATPIALVITDLVSVHTAWFERDVDLCLVPTDAVAEKALDNGLSARQVKVTGIPVHPQLAHPPADRRALRASLGWDEERPTALVLGGGAGVGRIEEVAAEIARRCPQAQIAIVAGKNEALRRRLADYPWPIPAHIYGFTERMPALMHASDVLVTKAGGLSVSEGLACGLPMVIYQVTPGQEEGNMTYVETRDAGVYAPTPEEAGEVLQRWLRPDSEELAYYAAQSRAAGHPHAAHDVARRVWKLAT
jgi:1,2-diacylglycerol 3-beta-galactosyltransferase